MGATATRVGIDDAVLTVMIVKGGKTKAAYQNF
jgi:hypothetical protein